MPKCQVFLFNQFRGKKRKHFYQKRTHLIWTIGNSRKETAKRLNQINKNFYFWWFLPHLSVSPEGRNTITQTWAARCVHFLCAVYLSLLRILSKLNSLRYWMSGPRQQITGLSREATLDSERQPGGNRDTKMEFSQTEAHRRYSKTQ